MNPLRLIPGLILAPVLMVFGIIVVLTDWWGRR